MSTARGWQGDPTHLGGHYKAFPSEEEWSGGFEQSRATDYNDTKKDHSSCRIMQPLQ